MNEELRDWLGLDDLTDHHEEEKHRLIEIRDALVKAKCTKTDGEGEPVFYPDDVFSPFWKAVLWEQVAMRLAYRLGDNVLQACYEVQILLDKPVGTESPEGDTCYLYAVAAAKELTEMKATPRYSLQTYWAEFAEEIKGLRPHAPYKERSDG